MSNDLGYKTSPLFLVKKPDLGTFIMEYLSNPYPSTQEVDISVGENPYRRPRARKTIKP